EIADDRACAFRRQHARAAQQHAEPIAALGEFAQQIASDEAGAAGQRDQRFGHVTKEVETSLRVRRALFPPPLWGRDREGGILSTNMDTPLPPPAHGARGDLPHKAGGVSSKSTGISKSP